MTDIFRVISEDGGKVSYETMHGFINEQKVLQELIAYFP
jgi:hypothetical protein